MKKYLFILAAFGACFALSCNKEATTDTPSKNGMKKVSFSAIIDDNLTKTSYENGTTFSWSAGDEISVLCSDGEFYTFSADQTGASTTFSGSIPENATLGDYAFFPADEGHLYSGLKFNLPEYKDLTAHPSADMPMVGDKGDDGNYTFMHCSGASLFTLTNIPDNIKSVTVSFVSASLKLSGLFGVFRDGENKQWKWNAAGGSTDSEKTFSRKVCVNNKEAQVYLPYACGADMWANNTVNVVGFDANGKEYALITDKKMKGSSYVYARAHVQPLKPLILNQLNYIDWSDNTIATYTLDDWQTATVALTELKATADSYYMYVRVTGLSSAITSENYLDIYLSDGEEGDYVWGDYWRTTGSVIYKKEHKGPVSASGFTMKFNDKSIDTAFETSGNNTFWYMALPREHQLLSSSGTIYVGVALWEGWSIIGCIPSKRTWDHDSYLMPVTLP